jgi:NAD-dependent SIR2 family protein deacetylase
MGHTEQAKCAKCGTALSEDDVMKVKLEDDSWATIPLPLCPSCFTARMRRLASERQDTL